MACSGHLISFDYHDTCEAYHHITFFQHTIDILVTAEPTAVDIYGSPKPITSTSTAPSSSASTSNGALVFPLSKTRSPPSICVGHRCLIFQILRSNKIPQSLVNFLLNPSYTFVGVGIQNDVEKLGRDYNLAVAKTVDLGTLAADAYGDRELNNAGLQKLSSMILGKEIKKEKSVTLSKWDNVCLAPCQVEYAAIDAFVSFEIGWVLITGNHV